jgi:adenylyltransferase/sulfurtransferase
MELREVKLQRNPDCPACGENADLTELRDYQEICEMAG